MPPYKIGTKQSLNLIIDKSSISQIIMNKALLHFFN